MQRSCPLCSAPFQITDADLAFYEKVSPSFKGKKELIPPPTLCPDCRVQRRMAWRNDRVFYHRKCDLTGTDILSMYAPDARFPVYKPEAWHGDGWDDLAHGRDFDFSRTFFDQWADLRDCSPHWAMALSSCENSDYCNYCTDEKNCYMDIAAEQNENCYYDHFTKTSKDCVDSNFAYHSTLCYEVIQCYGCYGCRWSQYLENCSDCTMCFDCKGCRHCLLCTNQRNKEYCIMNEQVTKEVYEARLEELRLSSHQAVEHLKTVWKDRLLSQGIFRDMYLLNCEGCSGNDIQTSKNCLSCFNAVDCEDCSYLYDILNAKDCADMNYSLYDPEADYEVISTVGLKHSAFYLTGPYNSYCFYSEMLKSCSHCFGCVALKKRQHCILNKQYTKEEYEELFPRIIHHMRKAGEWGEFFPVVLSPHGYNETVAMDHFPLTKSQAKERGWRWKDRTEETAKITKIIPATQLPDAIQDIPDDILHWAINCEVTGKPYKIIKQELEYYRRMQIPVPRLHPDERHRRRVVLSNPRKLWNRTCGKCQRPITTSYSSERPEKVLCEACYLKEVY